MSFVYRCVLPGVRSFEKTRCEPLMADRIRDRRLVHWELSESPVGCQ